MAKYRIIECIKPGKKWFEVERKGWFKWHTENILISGFIFYVEFPIEFKTYEEAKKHVTDKLPKPKKTEETVNRYVYEVIES